MKNKVIRVKVAGIIALPVLGLFLGFFSGVSAAQMLLAPAPVVVHPCKLMPPSQSLLLEPIETSKPVKIVEFVERPQKVEIQEIWRDSIEQKIDAALRNPNCQIRRGIKNPEPTRRPVCIEPLRCDG